MSETGIKSIEKEIDYHISVKNNFWNATVLTVAGTLGLAFIQFNIIYKLIFIITGFFFALIFVFGYFRRCDKINYLIKELKEKF